MDENEEPTPPPAAAPSLDEIGARLQAAFERAKGQPFGESEADEENDAHAARLERLEAQIDGGTGTKMPFPDETELDGALRHVEHKVRGVQEQRAQKQANTDRIRRAEQESAKGLGTGLAVAYALIGLPMAGAGLGWFLNRATGGNVWLPIFAIAGMATAIWWTIRTTNRQNGS